MSGWHQAYLSVLAAATAALSMVPLELQRRVVNDAIGGGNVRLLVLLASIYLAVVLLQVGLKYLLRMYQNWVGESATRYTRMHLSRLNAARRSDGPGESGGRAAAIIGAEVEQLGAFVGESVSEPLVNLGILAALLGYMLVVEPLLALVSLGFLIPQVILIPLIQRVINRLIERQVGLLRGLGATVADEDGSGASDRGQAAYDDRIGRIYGNRMRIHLFKFAGKALVNLFNAVAPLTALAVGGYLAIRGETSLGIVVAFVSGFERLADPLRELLAFYRLMAQTRIRHEMIARWM